MEIVRNGITYKLTDEELFQAHTEHIKNFMYGELYNEFGFSAEEATQGAEIAYDKYAKGDGLTEYECIEFASDAMNKMKSEEKLKLGKEKFYRYELIDYFCVLGNVSDGWRIDGQCVLLRDLQISNKATDKEIINYLVDINYIPYHEKDKVGLRWLDNSNAELFIKRTLKPLARLCKAELRREYL